MTQELMSDAVLDKVEDIAAVTSKKEKEVLIGDYWKEDRLFRTLVGNALDPFITFGIQKIPKYESNEGGRQFNATTIRILKDLRDRTLTGKKAQEAVAQELNELSPKSSELLTRIIKCSLKAGFSESSVNKAIPNAIYVFKPMLAHSFDDYCHELTYPVYAEVKEDGVRGFCLENKECEFVSRNGLPLFGDAEPKEQAYQLMRQFRYHWGLTCSDKKVVIDGEMVEANDCFNDSVGGARRKGGSKTMMFKVIDILWQEEFDNRKSKHSYKKRREVLNKIFSPENSDNFPRLKLVETKMMASEEHCREYFKRVHASGKEGLIIKPSDGLSFGKVNVLKLG
ncbi:hypothetical protein KI655_18505 [Vibrio sp. D404a]|uniref:ATP-dependent DNA ligase n=1 Tax=unclassified Vibrio TaxID=2614977 RepID=UPI002552FFA8|nr:MULTISPECIES: RNA ligase family protein [unclassified Vibrio]MDK9739290.1 hypothetical protein [Vibrio sp. D404a]MDK9797674.1 hypothetical protein [Vibrio sp. D449a]